MATRRKPEETPQNKRPPATTPEARENQLIAMAADEAEKQIREGRATSQLLTHFLKLGTTREKLEQDRLRKENELLTAKVEQIQGQQQMIELYADALKAMSSYRGDTTEETYDD